MLTGPITIAQAIQISVAPVFLLTGVAALIVVYTSRLGRIIDRIRTIHGQTATSSVAHEKLLLALGRRINFIHMAIVFAALAGVFVSAVIGVIFLGYIGEMNLIVEIAFLFLAATFLLTLSLVSFLLELNTAARSLRIEMAHAAAPSEPEDSR